jgi:hypothetical protein
VFSIATAQQSRADYERVGTDKLGVAFAVTVARRLSRRERERAEYVWDMGPGEQVMYIMAVPRMTAEGYSLARGMGVNSDSQPNDMQCNECSFK